MSTQQQERKGFFESPTMRKLMRVAVVLWALLIVSVLVSALASHFKNKGGQADKTVQVKTEYQSTGIAMMPEVLKFIQNMVLDDMLTTLVGGNSYSDKRKVLQILNIVANVEARTLVREYAENEVAADQKYKARKGHIIVSGIIDSINKDFKGDPYVSLRGNDFFQSVHASFSIDETEFLAELKKGQNAMFVCNVGEIVIAQVALRNCTSLAAHVYGKENRASSGQYVVDVFSGKQKASTKEEAEALAAAWFLGRGLSANSPCLDPIFYSSAECVEELNTIVKSSTKSPTKEEDKVKLMNMIKALSPD